jgi:hypothetical protein
MSQVYTFYTECIKNIYISFCSVVLYAVEESVPYSSLIDLMYGSMKLFASYGTPAYSTAHTTVCRYKIQKSIFPATSCNKYESAKAT